MIFYLVLLTIEQGWIHCISLQDHTALMVEALPLYVGTNIALNLTQRAPNEHQIKNHFSWSNWKRKGSFPFKKKRKQERSTSTTKYEQHCTRAHHLVQQWSISWHESGTKGFDRLGSLSSRCEGKLEIERRPRVPFTWQNRTGAFHLAV